MDAEIISNFFCLKKLFEVYFDIDVIQNFDMNGLKGV